MTPLGTRDSPRTNFSRRTDPQDTKMKDQHRFLGASVTNTHACIAVCSCGWIGYVHPSISRRGKRNASDYAKYAAEAEWRTHQRGAWEIDPVTVVA